MKIVYSKCYGGFSLSRQAVLLGRELSGDPQWAGPCIVGDHYPSGEPVRDDYGFAHDLKRSDPTLVEVVERLGNAASGRMARLAIDYVPNGERYRIEEYDGFETVMRISDYTWEIAE